LEADSRAGAPAGAPPASVAGRSSRSCIGIQLHWPQQEGCESYQEAKQDCQEQENNKREMSSASMGV